VTVPVPEVQAEPWLAFAETRLVPLGSVSVTVTLSASVALPLVTVRV
jgi:hypothetical protein